MEEIFSVFGTPLSVGDTVYRFSRFTKKINSITFTKKHIDDDFFRFSVEYYTPEEYWNIKQYNKKEALLNSRHEMEFIRMTARERLGELNENN